MKRKKNPLEMKKISSHLAIVWGAIRSKNEPWTNEDVIKETGVGGRTVRKHMSDLASIGIIELHYLFPKNYYSMPNFITDSHCDYISDLNNACDIINKQK